MDGLFTHCSEHTQHKYIISIFTFDIGQVEKAIGRKGGDSIFDERQIQRKCTILSTFTNKKRDKMPFIIFAK